MQRLSLKSQILSHPYIEDIAESLNIQKDIKEENFDDRMAQQFW